MLGKGWDDKAIKTCSTCHGVPWHDISNSTTTCEIGCICIPKKEELLVCTAAQPFLFVGASDDASCYAMSYLEGKEDQALGALLALPHITSIV